MVARKAFAFSIVGADELSGYALGISMAWGFAWVLVTRAHLRVDALYNLLPARLCRVLDVVSLIAFLGFVGLLLERAAFVVGETVTYGSLASTPLATPLIWPQGVWLAGLALFAFALLVVLLRAAWALARGDLETVRRIAAAPSVNEGADDV